MQVVSFNLVIKVMTKSISFGQKTLQNYFSTTVFCYVYELSNTCNQVLLFRSFECSCIVDIN